MIVNIIVAYCKNNGIGFNNTMPWKIKSDLKKFRRLSTGNGNNAIIMGKNTYNSLNCDGLPNRDNLILSTTIEVDKLINTNITKSFNNIEKLEDFVKLKNYDEVWIIGGEKIYNLFLQWDKDTRDNKNNDNRNKNNKGNNIFKIDNIYVTYIDKEFECDTFFPVININSQFKFISQELHTVESDLYEFDVFDKIFTRI